MTVEELIEELQNLPRTAIVRVQIRRNVGYQNGDLDDLYEFREADPVTLIYDFGTVQIQLDE